MTGEQENSYNLGVSATDSTIESSVSQQFRCQCGKAEAWISKNQETLPCPECGRRYRGRYDRDTCRIEAVLITSNPT